VIKQTASLVINFSPPIVISYYVTTYCKTLGTDGWDLTVDTYEYAENITCWKCAV